MNAEPMNVLAIEWSTEVGSMALLSGEQLVAAQTMKPDARRVPALFDAIQDLMRQAGWAWPDIAAYAAGCGPGRYSGMRVAVVAAEHLALPGKQPVYGISSGVALAHAVAATHPERQWIAVVGDARRGQWWWGLFAVSASVCTLLSGWQLVTAPDHSNQATAPSLDQALASHGVAADEVLWTSAEWSRLDQAWTAWCDARGVAPAIVDQAPTAEWVGRLAGRHGSAGTAIIPPRPIYIHPPVAQAP